MEIQLNTSFMKLEDEPLDIGYGSEKVTVCDAGGTAVTLGGQNGTTQLFITLPFLDAAQIEELRVIAATLPKGGDYPVQASVVVASDIHDDPAVEGLGFYRDKEGEFGDWYGVRIKDAPLSGEFTKAIILISKDGALFYDEFVSNLHNAFDLPTLERKILAAQLCYTGKGCH